MTVPWADPALIELTTETLLSEDFSGLFSELGSDVAPYVAQAILRALFDNPCPVCGGDGYTAEHDPACDGSCRQTMCPVQIRCEDCEWTGQAAGPPAWMLTMWEQVGSCRKDGALVQLSYAPEYWHPRGPQPLPAGEPVYRWVGPPKDGA